MDMEPPITPKPMPASAANLPLEHINKLFGIVYITLMGVIDTIVPAAGPWPWVGKSMSYLIKLAPILWWALPTQSAARQFPNTSKPANQGWFPDTFEAALPLLLYPPPHKLPANQLIRTITLIWNNFLSQANLLPYSQSGFSSRGPASQETNHHHPNSPGNCGVQQPNKQGESDWHGQEAKKAPKSQITEVYPIMLDLLQQDPKLSLTQVQKQLSHHGIWMSEHMVQLWMHRKVASIRVLTNAAGNQWDGSEDSPYDHAIESTLVQCLTSLTYDIIIISYYKLSIDFDNFGAQGRSATKKGRKKVKRGTFIGAFLAVSAKGFVYYWIKTGFANGYKYHHILRKLLYS
ncbi:hypothetical protein DSO57_1013572 [Entomophthora muscae]|uniref:Uncharacterized protein n=1 Tax=Entomophthora muscae TaxID=34485 RepID=A0ACC2S7S7_9FUNG|nr:hypothetical protein DSO57_1013572 [Entomophthora muscae]